MDKTLINLARAFAGESQAHMRYVLYAKAAKKEGMHAVGNMFAEIAENETAHAKLFLKEIANLKPGALNLNIEAGFPMVIGTLEQNLFNSAHGEKEEYISVYPSFAQIAREEGMDKIAHLFEGVARVEKCHCDEFTRIANLVKEGRLYSSKTEVTWRCIHCGHEHKGTQPWIVCPVCAHPQGFVAIPKQ